MEKTIAVPASVLQELLSYLVTKPYVEVAKLIQTLAKLSVPQEPKSS